MIEAARYQRHSLIDWFDQSEITQAKVCVIGAGAIGNEVIKNLVLLGVGHIEVFDFDKIEIHNLTRSVLFREEDVGSFKADAACRRAANIDPNVKLISHNCDFWDILTPSRVRSFDVVFCCVDNFEARLKINKLCYLASVNLVNSGIDSRYASIEVFPFGLIASCACYECNLPLSVYQRVSERYSCGWLKKVSFVERKVPTTIVTSAISGALAVSIGLKLGGKVEAESMPRRVLVDTKTGLSSIADLERNPECPCCSQLTPASSIVKVNRSLREVGGGFPDYSSSRAVIVSCEPILVGYYRTDLDANDALIPVFKPASNYDDSFASSVSENPESVLTVIRDQFSPKEFFEQLEGLEVPVKFVMLIQDRRNTIMEVE